MPRELRLTFSSVDLGKRAYWGESLLGGESGALNMGSLPGGGIWHRLEIPVDDLGLAGKTIVQVEAAISNGQVWLDRFAVSGAEAPALITAFTSSHPSPQTAGTTITWTVAAAGSVHPLEYRFEREDAGVWSVVQPYGSGNAYSWTPTASDAGDHALRVSVRNGGSLSDFDDTASLPMTITPSSGSLRAPRATIAERIRRMFGNERAPISLGVTYDAVSATSVNDRRRYSLYTPELNLLAETVTSASATPAVEYEYIWFGGQPAAQVEVSTGSIDSYFNDHLGTPLLQTSSSGAVVWRAEYEPYGAVQSFRVGVSKHQPLRLPGQESAEGTEASYNIFRWYRAGWGRYTQADPLGIEGGTNLYGYAASNPLTFVDPFGLAYFAKRPLQGAPWIPLISCSPFYSLINAEPSHEQLFFEDGKQPSNVGFFGDGTLETEHPALGFRCPSGKYNDCVIREAVKQVGDAETILRTGVGA